MAVSLVFDAKQTLYTFRNAAPNLAYGLRAILGDDVQHRSLLRNYRSNANLVKLANYFSDVFQDNSFLPIERDYSIPFKKAEPGFLSVKTFDTIYNEMSYMAGEISNLNTKKGVKFNDIAILCRTNRNLVHVETALVSKSIPYIIKYDSRSLMNQSPYKFMISLYGYLLNQKDVYSFCELILALKGVGRQSAARIREDYLMYLSKVNAPVSVHQFIKDKRDSKKITETIVNFITVVLEATLEWYKNDRYFTYQSLISYIKNVLMTKFGYDDDDIEHGRSKYNITMDRRHVLAVFDVLSNIYEIQMEDISFRAADEKAKFLWIYNALMLSQCNYSDTLGKVKKERDAVSVYTIHAYKGLEAPYIFGCNLRPTKPVQPRDFDDQCAFYVMVTRPKNFLGLYSSERNLSIDNKLIKTPENMLLNKYVEGISRLNRGE